MSSRASRAFAWSPEHIDTVHRHMIDRKKKPEAIGNIVASWLDKTAVPRSGSIRRASFPEWAKSCGSTDRDGHGATIDHGDHGTLFVQVTTNAWMNELSLLEPELLRSLNQNQTRVPVKRIRWILGETEASVNHCPTNACKSLSRKCCIWPMQRLVNFLRLISNPDSAFVRAVQTG